MSQFKATCIVTANEARPLRSIGGTDASALMGANPYLSVPQMYDRLMGRVELVDNAWVRRGRALEPVVRDQFYEDHPTLVRHFDGVIIRDTLLPHVHASVDGIYAFTPAATARPNPSFGVFEAKTMQQRLLAEVRATGISATYYAQVQHYLWVTGLEVARFGILDPAGWDFHYVQVERNESYVRRLAEAVERFVVDHLLPESRPLVENGAHYATQGMMVTPVVMPGTDGVTLNDPGLQAAFQLYREGKAIERRGKEMVDNARRQLAAAMPEYMDVVYTPWGRLNNRASSTTRLDEARLEAEHPELDLSAYRSTRRSVTMYVTPAGDQ